MTFSDPFRILNWVQQHGQNFLVSLCLLIKVHQNMQSWKDVIIEAAAVIMNAENTCFGKQGDIYFMCMCVLGVYTQTAALQVW